MKLPPSLISLAGMLLGFSVILSSGLSADAPTPASTAANPTDNSAYVTAAQGSPGHAVSRDMQERVVQLWSDTPAYVALFNDKTKAKQRARVQSTVPPVPPLVPALPGVNTHVTVSVSFVVDETGGVEAARVLDSTDPRFNQSAVDAVLQWRFFPAEGEHGFIKSYFVVPIQFNGERPEDIAIGLAVGRPSRVASTQIYVRGPNSPPPPQGPPTAEWSVNVQLQGPGAADVKSGRIIISRAFDDRGAELHSASNPTFYHPAVGSTSSDEFVRTPPPWLGFHLSGADLTAKKILSVEGNVELVIPRLDPTGAIAVIDHVSKQIGSPAESPALRAAHVTLVIYDKATADRYRAEPDAAGGPADYDDGPFFGKMPVGIPSSWPKMEMAPNDLAIGISDPDGKLVGMEFQAADGQPVRYNHNGGYHSGNSPGKRMDVYNLGSPLPRDVKLVCWLITPRSLFRQPLKIAELPLPDR